jgi:DNA polymerase delta subunit 1
MSKKRYAGLSWTRPEEAGKLDAKGIEVVRRDFCELVRQMVDRCLHLLMQERSAEKAIAYVQETISMLRQGHTDPRLLVISKALVREGAEAYAAKQAHVELAEKLRRRCPANAPQIGERVPYVFIAAAAGTPQYARAEDPRYALENELPIDAEYYIEHQLKGPLLRIFEPILQEPEDKIKQRLFAGDPAKQVARTAPSGAGPLAAFVRKRAKCIGCRSLLPPSSPTLCPSCVEPEKATKVLLGQIASCRRLEAEAARMFSQCSRCEGSTCGKLHLECVNVDCPIFFRRLQVAGDLNTVQANLKKLQLDW